ncbi:MAG: hypothetical protein AB7E79_09645 [Rhodospirillaceae bacterium]
MTRQPWELPTVAEARERLNGLAEELRKVRHRASQKPDNKRAQTRAQLAAEGEQAIKLLNSLLIGVVKTKGGVRIPVQRWHLIDPALVLGHILGELGQPIGRGGPKGYPREFRQKVVDKFRDRLGHLGDYETTMKALLPKFRTAAKNLPVGKGRKKPYALKRETVEVWLKSAGINKPANN